MHNHRKREKLPNGAGRRRRFGMMIREDLRPIAESCADLEHGLALLSTEFDRGRDARIKRTSNYGRGKARATENALYKSEAVASLMRGSVESVQSVSVLEVTWGAPDKNEPGEGADSQRVLCSAKVHVVYRMSFGR